MAGAENEDRIACIQCDLPLVIDELEPGERARCPRCGYFLASGIAGRYDRALALALAAAVFLVLANSFPFLHLQSSGLETVMTLPRTAVQLYDEGYTALSVLVLGVIVAVPSFVLCAVFGLVVPLRRGQHRPWLVPVARFLFVLTPWAMVEVFIIGVIVSLVKIGHMAHVILGAAFWSYVGFAVCFTGVLAYLDRLSVWRAIERSAR